MKKLYIILAAALIAITSCSKFDEMNVTSTGLTEEQLPPSNIFARLVYKGIYSDHQRNMNLYDDMYAYYFSDNTTWWSGLFGAYNDGWGGCMWWQFYDQSLQYNKLIAKSCEGKDAYTSMKAISDIYTVYLWTRVTDRWGDVPYTGAGNGENVDYTSQKEIYADLLKRLEEDAAALSTTVPQFNPGNYDILYGGNFAKWQKFANSLMLRLATRVAKADPAMCKTYAQKAIAGGLMTSYEDVANLPCDASVWGDYYDRTSYDWGQTAPDANFVSVLNGTNPGYRTGVQDPRLKIFFKPALTGDNAGKYIGYPHGNPTAADAQVAMSFKKENDVYTVSYFSVLNEDDPDGYFFNNAHKTPVSNLAFPILTYSETLFCQAELALRGIVSGDAEALYKKGIEASIKEAAAHTAPLGKGVKLVKDEEIQAYINALPAFGSSNEQKLRSIILQKWIALYPNSTEGWNEIRRTGYPDIKSGVINYAGTSAAALVQSGNTIQRLSYPDNAYDYDMEHIPADYKAGGKCHTYRMQHGVWWSYAGENGTFASTTTPSNF